MDGSSSRGERTPSVPLKLSSKQVRTDRHKHLHNVTKPTHYGLTSSSSADFCPEPIPFHIPVDSLTHRFSVFAKLSPSIPTVTQVRLAGSARGFCFPISPAPALPTSDLSQTHSEEDFCSQKALFPQNFFGEISWVAQLPGGMTRPNSLPMEAESPFPRHLQWCLIRETRSRRNRASAGLKTKMRESKPCL